jgi:hypothetical protein
LKEESGQRSEQTRRAGFDGCSGALTSVDASMKTRLTLFLIAQAAFVAGFAVALRSGAMPLGVRGEWEWLRVPAGPSWADVLLTGAAVMTYAVLAALGMRALQKKESRGREALVLLGLLGASVAIQLILPGGAPVGYGLTRWAVVLHSPGSSGYYTVARRQIGDTRRFLADYPDWIRHQDALHVGTHPPGLFLVEHGLLRLMETQPGLARLVLDHLPEPVVQGFRMIGPVPPADRAAIALTAALTWLACAATVAPLYLLARANLSAPAAWASAALWPLVPSTILFQPDADTAFPLLSTTALALAAQAGRTGGRRGVLLAALAGVVLAIGMMFTLAFLPVGLVVAIILASSSEATRSLRAGLIAATGAGFLVLTFAFWAITRANPFVIWWWNQRNHARFYVEFSRSYRAWVVVNLLELAVALGLPATLGAIIGFLSIRQAPRAAWAALAVLILLDLSGRNLSEVARLWLPLMPPLLTASGLGLTRLGGGPKALTTTLLLLGAETMILQATIQVVYPF